MSTVTAVCALNAIGQCSTQTPLISAVAITCFSRKHVHGGRGWSCRSSGSHLGNPGERCWRWGWSLLLQRERELSNAFNTMEISEDSPKGSRKVTRSKANTPLLTQGPRGTTYLLLWFIQIHPPVFLFIPNNLPKSLKEKKKSVE